MPVTTKRTRAGIVSTMGREKPGVADRWHEEVSRGVFERLENPDLGRELATKFVARRRIPMRELMSLHRLPRMLENLRRAIRAMAEKRRSLHETVQMGMEV